MKCFSNRLKIQTRLKISQGRPDFVPFLGVFFLLLIFFMLGSSLFRYPGFRVSLPEVQVRHSFGAKKIIVTVDKQGRIFLNDIEFQEMSALKTRLLDIVNTAAQDRSTIILRADAQAEYGTVARIMSLAEDLKINVFLLTSSPASSRETVRLIEQE